MKAVARDGALNWGISVAVAIGSGLFAVNWFRVPAASAPMVRAPAKPVSVVRIAATEAALSDKIPLFLPTAWNTSQEEIRMPDSSATLTRYPSRFAFPESELRLENLPVAVVTPATPADALTLSPVGPLFEGLGRSDRPINPVSKRGAYVEVVAVSSGRMVLGEALLAANPPSVGVWQALEFLALVDASGLVSLDLTARSGVEHVDSYFSRFLAQKLRIGARLAPGSYRISVGP